VPISYTYNTVFIHIPKCAGTTIEKILGTCTLREYYHPRQDAKNGKIKTPQHSTYLELKSDLAINWNDYFVFSVVRNPYSRFVSEYNYRRNLFMNTKLKEHDPVNFETFVNSLNIEVPKRIQQFDGHLETQTSFLKNESGSIEPSIQIFRFEDLAPCWTKLEEKTGVQYKTYLWSRKSIDSTPYQSFYTPDIKSIIYEFYKEDFVNFGYSSEL
jgi:chondroitin 4-sulfotransferase 11